ncbi:MAG: VanZ family protein [Bacteroidia bacterium]
MIKRFLKQYPYTAAVLWALVIFGLCSTPGRFIPTTSWLELLSFDKWVHASVFFTLCTLCFAGVTAHEQPASYKILFFVLAIAYGGLLEILQANVFSQRSGDWLDFIANSFGCTMALVFCRRMMKLLF